MWQAVGHLLPIAVAVAVSSVPIMVMIMILLSPKRKLSALAFMCGWAIGIALVVFVCALAARALPEPPRRSQDTLAGVLKIVIGAALVCASVISLAPLPRSHTAGMTDCLRSVGAFGPAPLASRERLHRAMALAHFHRRNGVREVVPVDHESRAAQA